MLIREKNGVKVEVVNGEITTNGRSKGSCIKKLSGELLEIFKEYNPDYEYMCDGVGLTLKEMELASSEIKRQKELPVKETIKKEPEKKYWGSNGIRYDDTCVVCGRDLIDVCNACSFCERCFNR